MFSRWDRETTGSAAPVRKDHPAPGISKTSLLRPQILLLTLAGRWRISLIGSHSTPGIGLRGTLPLSGCLHPRQNQPGISNGSQLQRKISWFTKLLIHKLLSSQICGPLCYSPNPTSGRSTRRWNRHNSSAGAGSRLRASVPPPFLHSPVYEIKAVRQHPCK